MPRPRLQGRAARRSAATVTRAKLGRRGFGQVWRGSKGGRRGRVPLGIGFGWFRGRFRRWAEGPGRGDGVVGLRCGLGRPRVVLGRPFGVAAAQEAGHPGAGVVGEDVAVLLVGEAQREGAGDLGLALGARDAALAEGEVLRARADAPG